MTENNYNLEFRTAQRRTTLAFINVDISTNTIFLNSNTYEDCLEYFEKYIEILLEHESIHLAILNAVGEHETRAYDNIYRHVDRIFW